MKTLDDAIDFVRVASDTPIEQAENEWSKYESLLNEVAGNSKIAELCALQALRFGLSTSAGSLKDFERFCLLMLSAVQVGIMIGMEMEKSQ